MDLPRRNSHGWAELLCMVLAMLLLSVAHASVAFHYGAGNGLNSQYFGLYNLTLEVPENPSTSITKVQQDDIICLGDFFQLDQALLLSLPQPLRSSDRRTDVSGRCLYRNPFQLKQSNALKSFSTKFTFQFNPELYTSACAEGYISGTLQGLAFIIASDNSTQGDPKGYLGWLNSTTNAHPGQAATVHNFAVEIDFFQDIQFDDPVARHVGIDINNLTSVAWSTDIGYDASASQVPRYVQEYTVWIEYDDLVQILMVFVNYADLSDSNYFKPSYFLLISPPRQIDLSGVLSQENIFVGFSGAISNLKYTSTLVTDNNQTSGFGFNIYDWTFNSDGLAPDLPRNSDGAVQFPGDGSRNSGREKIIIISATIPSVLIFFLLVFIIWKQYMRNARLTELAKKYGIEEVMLEGGPQNFKYKVLSRATKGFSAHEVLGSGGFGSVYRGRLLLKGAEKPTDVAVKRMSNTSHQGAQEFLAEVKVIGQAQHRNLVRLLGWCHERGELLLVYDYMPNGSVDQHLFKYSDGDPVLTWARRLKVISGVATALAYLHEEWEQRVIHRDVKSSNVMLDSDFNARLGDFGLARLSQHDQAPPSTVVLAGTYGYLASELAHTLKATEKTDVYSFGAMVLEVATGKRPLLSFEDQKASGMVLLVDWVWAHYTDDALLKVADCRLEGAYDSGEMILFLKIGLLCSHPDPDVIPNMREVLSIWKGSIPFPSLPLTKPVPTFISRIEVSALYTTINSSAAVYGHRDGSGSRTLSLGADSEGTLTVPSKGDGDATVLGTPVDKLYVSQNSVLRRRHFNAATALPL